MGNKSTQSGGIGLGMLLFLIFMILKLTHYIDWSWWYVTMPLWGGAVLILAFFSLFIIVAILAIISKIFKQ